MTVFIGQHIFEPCFFNLKFKNLHFRLIFKTFYIKNLNIRELLKIIFNDTFILINSISFFIFMTYQ
jgi:hypothetical protein